MRKVVYCALLGLVLCGLAAAACGDDRVAALKEQIIDIQNADAAYDFPLTVVE